MDNESINLSNEIFVPVNDRSIKVCKLGLLDYAKMSRILRELIASIIEVFQEDSMMVMQNTAPTADQQLIIITELISALIEKNIVAVINFIDTCVPDIGREYLEQKVGPYDVVRLFDAVLTVNQINQAVEEGKKLMTNYMRNKEA